MKSGANKLYYITIFIETLCLTGFVTYLGNEQAKLVTKKELDFSRIDNFSPKTWITELGHHVDNKKTIFRIILTDDNILQGSLPLPNMNLQEYEIETYVINSLVKLFHTQELLSYDYHQIKEGGKKQIIVSAYSNQKLEPWFALSLQSRVDFIGVASEVLEPLTSEKNIATFSEQLAYQPKIIGFNFLPWRKANRKKRKMVALFSVVAYLLISTIIMLWLFCLSVQQQDQQTIKNQQLQLDIRQKAENLLRLEELDRTLKQQQTSIHQHIMRQHKLIGAVNLLELIANQIPDNLWLNSLSYVNERLTLTGGSFWYDNILTFSQSLNELESLQGNHIVNIKQYKDLLQFELELLFVNLGLDYAE